MATDNRGVMVYLNPELERRLEQYCIDNDITHKNKNGIVLPSLGTKIVQYLKSTLLSTASRTASSLLLNAVPHPSSSTSLSSAPSNRLSAGTPSTVLTREEVVAIVREEIDSHSERLRQRALGSIEAAASGFLPLAFVPFPEKVEVENMTAANPQDPTNWEEPIAELAAEGMSSRQIADRLNLLGFTNTKGGAVSRQSIENYLSRRPDLKATYEKARKKGD